MLLIKNAKLINMGVATVKALYNEFSNFIKKGNYEEI